jgi:hypothetical protein
LGLQLATSLVAMINLYLWRPLPVLVPGQPFNIALMLLQAAALVIALRSQTSRPD